MSPMYKTVFQDDFLPSPFCLIVIFATIIFINEILGVYNEIQ